jgi:uncharacterized protein (UPF0548 family)
MAVVSVRMMGDPEADRLRRAPFTYAEVGGTRGELPAGYRRLRRRVTVGTGAARFEEAAHTVLGWQMHRRAGLSVRASSGSVVEDAVAVLRLGWRFLGVSAPVRVVYVVHQPHRRGFAYGTLPGHPESGEEAFDVQLHPDGQVTFTITAFSRPSSMLARAGGPISSLIQSWATNRYLRSVQACDRP